MHLLFRVDNLFYLIIYLQWRYNSARNNKKIIVFQLKISQYTDDKLQKMVIDEIQKQFKNVAISLKIYSNIYVIMIK